MRKDADANNNVGPDKEMRWIRADLKAPGDPVRYFIDQMKKKYGEEEGMAMLEKARRHIEELLAKQESHD